MDFFEPLVTDAIWANIMRRAAEQTAAPAEQDCEHEYSRSVLYDRCEPYVRCELCGKRDYLEV